MGFDFDILCIGLGPAGMAVSIMGSAMGLKVGAIEAHKIGGECMNVGCIPSKGLLQIAKHRAAFDKLPAMGMAAVAKPEVLDPFGTISGHIKYINDEKTKRMFDKVELIMGHRATFAGPRTLDVGGRKLTARKIFLCAGTRPALPAIPGLDNLDVLTNETMFSLEKVPKSLLVIGSGAIASEMAQAFARLGSEVTVVMRGPRLLHREDPDAAALLHEAFERDGIRILTGRTMEAAEKRDGHVALQTAQDGWLTAERLLSATGRRYALADMNLAAAGIEHDASQGVKVDKYLRTTNRHVFACGDVNGHAQLSHAAMHQGMLALMNAMLPWRMRRDFRKYVVPWTVFTEPQYSFVGLNETQLKERGIKYETIRINYGDYGAAIAEGIPDGFLKVFASPAGRIYGAYVIGEGSGEMINEWGLAIQKKLRLSDVMFLQHSFPSMSFLNKRVAEQWMMTRMQSDFLKRMATWVFRRGRGAPGGAVGAPPAVPADV
ncbi:MAG: dihydrolipoyl dehydrogenase family protein [Phycisphaerae bacterium]